MPPVGFEPRISVLERTKTVHALDGAATAIGEWGGGEERLHVHVVRFTKYISCVSAF
jgi:hypothetical protein